jgi:acyl carrier protein
MLVNNYGPTECTVVATSGPVFSQERPDVLPTIGRPIANAQVYILDEQLQELPAGTAGEIYIGGAGVGQGYLNRSDLTSERFIQNPSSSQPNARLYKTGDLGRYLPNGEIAFLGRVDDQIKIRGYRIEPNEIVTALNRHPAIRASQVVAREDQPGNKRLVAYVVPTPESRPTEDLLRTFLRTSLPEYMVPAVFVCLESLPTTLNGKIDRDALPVPTVANTLRDEAFNSPRTVLEERISNILASLLGLEQVGVDDNFFLLGGHSLLGTQVIGQVRDMFGVELSLRSLFEAPTVVELATEVERLLFAKLDSMSEEEAQRMLSAPAST